MGGRERLRGLSVEIRWGGFPLAGPAAAVLAAVIVTVTLAVLALWLASGRR